MFPTLVMGRQGFSAPTINISAPGSSPQAGHLSAHLSDNVSREPRVCMVTTQLSRCCGFRFSTRAGRRRVSRERERDIE